jgi:hypothetical protein
MTRYDGDVVGDPPCNGGKWVKENGYGSEIYNFKPYRNKVYGYVSNTRDSININKLGASTSDESVSGVRVFWTATPPKGGRRLIGWYDNATVYRTWHTRPRASAFPKGGTAYIITAATRNAHLIPADQRLIRIPNARDKSGGLARNLGYVEDTAGQKVVDAIVNELKELGIGQSSSRQLLGKSKSVGSRGGWSNDPDERQEIERAAMNAVKEYFSSHWELDDVHKKPGLGYDFIARRRGESDLHLEVKGCKGTLASFELTPSEYRHIIERRKTFRLCVLTSALKSSRRLQIFKYHPGTDKWQDDNSQNLAIEELMGARCSCSK